MESQVNEKTPMVPVGDPGPSYVLPGHPPRLRERQAKQFQCCICTGLLSAFFMALIIAVTYTLWGPSVINFRNSTEANDTRITMEADNQLPTNFFILFPLTDELQTNWTIQEPNEEELKKALDAGKEALGDKEMIEEIILAPALNTPTFRHQRAVATTHVSRLASKRGYVEDHATKFLLEKSNNKRSYKKRWNVGRGPNSNLTKTDSIKCRTQGKYRNFDGTCNNLKHPRWGSAYIPFRRALNPDYCDGAMSPRCAFDGTELASAREISITVHRPSYYTDPQFTVMLAVWGQFLDHDITSTALNQGQDGEPIECCGDSDPKHPECFPVPLGKGDPYFDDYNLTCMNFVRSVPAPTDYLGPREQFNQATAFIDGSVVYGSTEEKVNELRSFQDGSLKMYVTVNNRTLLPVNENPRDGCNEADENAKGRYCFDSGDARSNENLHLTSMHLLLARHHNYLAKGLKRINSDWDDEKLFQESRRILGAQMQHITYNEFLSVIIGKDASEKFGILSTPEGMNDTYDDNVNPSMANEFAAAAFRFAHTLLPGLMKVTKELNDTEESISLHNMLFNPYSLYRPDGLDNAIRTAMNNSLEKSDPYFTTELTEKLFAKDASPMICGLDLVSLNIQRGRDHGLPAYPEWRKHCRLPKVDTWDDLSKAIDSQSFKTIKEIYKSPQDIDIYTGGLAEMPVKGGIIGPLLTCLIGDQFVRLKKGDAFWYERTIGQQKFTRDQLHQIFNTTLSTIICRNSDAVEYSQRYVMKRVSKTNKMEKCDELDTFDFEPWRMKQKSNKLARVEIPSDQSKANVIKN
ncbi:CLUMA_CG007975, isoform A [Clunio marinus]|uniref:CLUMA_CG007975, isoform A n=1 Tax=Clunio marinus TaxID=568069 RepID=A0A1J1I2G2_9DIPT|nr:CLUMA_CG007975, isoform A [Clunio marinus]